jgi:hypothetical protein
LVEEFREQIETFCPSETVTEKKGEINIKNKDSFVQKSGIFKPEDGVNQKCRGAPKVI